MACRIGVDAGGTFTDFVLVKEGVLSTHKVLSTPNAPEQAILQGLMDLGLMAEDAPPFNICHGSTIATNATLEGKGARTAFVTNEGFEDLLLLGRQARESLYDLTPPAARRTFRNTGFFGLSTRRGARGELLQPLTEKALDSLVDELKAWRPDSIAVNLLFSYVDGAEEQALRQRLPADALVTLSSELLPRHEEYERGVAVWLNAWLEPLVHRYLTRLCSLLKGAQCSVMQSSGLTITADLAAAQAVHLLLSGPAGGVAAAAYLAQRTDHNQLITFDMGGTSTDVSLVTGAPTLTDQGAVGPYPIAIPMVDIHTIGAGGGSLASVDIVGMLRVGPESAGANPGPACYGLGGEQATVTDANLYLGYLLPEHFLGGRMKLKPRLAEQALAKLGEEISLTPTQAANGIIDIVNEHMAQALRMVTLERGLDPTEFTLCCFGGAGGLHLCALADSFGIKRAIVPAHGGVLSAFGMLVAPAGRELSYSIQKPLLSWPDKHINDQLKRLANQGRAQLQQEGISGDQVQVELALELRYQGQSHAISVPWSSQRKAAQIFESQHEQRYGFNLDRAIEIVNIKASLSAPGRQLQADVSASPDQMTPISYSECMVLGKVPVFERMGLVFEETIAGPAIICEEISTTLVLPGWRCLRQPDETLLLLA